MKTISEWIEEFLDYRFSLGYKMETEKRLLRDFGRYVDLQHPNEPLTAIIALEWARLPVNGASLYWARRLEVVRPFYKHLIVFKPETAIIENGLLGPAHRRIQPHIYTKDEISDLIGACRGLNPTKGLRPHTYGTMLGLIYSAGLRTCEARKLKRDDFDRNSGFLTIRETKFHKSRLLPLHCTTVDVLTKYQELRDHSCPLPVDRNFFLSDRGTALAKATIYATFSKLRRTLGWEATEKSRAPRIYDLRHTFACNRITNWQKEGKDLNKLLPALATYMGHVKLADTYWYLSGVPELFHVVGQQFEYFIKGAQS